MFCSSEGGFGKQDTKTVSVAWHGKGRGSRAPHSEICCPLHANPAFTDARAASLGLALAEFPDRL